MSRQQTVAVLSLLAVACTAACAARATPAPTALPTARYTITATRPVATYTATPVRPTETAISTPTVAWTTLAIPSYRITLRYPSGWQFIPGYGIKYGGAGGFFQISAISGPSASLDEIAQGDAYHKLLPYGSEPTIEPLEVDGQPARLILPSADQPQAMAGQSGLIVQLPQPIDISGDEYNFLVLWADEQHIRQIAKTLTLSKPVS
jgi:TolB protein